ncbi:hypothetical protein N6H14_08955 [Paenibacillus sp. CC-CFT747]|nr:hypothetical protein N6H14_08955 [Paenibacillus sp. CC-CFT747]
MAIRKRGEDWLDRSPSGFTSQAFHFAYALDGEHAWLVERPQAASAEEEKDALSRWSLLHTSDGGRSWERRAFPAPAQWQDAGVNTASDFYFIDDRTGYALISSDPATGPVHMVLLATEDGGRTWTTRTAMERGLDQGNPSSLVFRNAKEGWISFHNAPGREPILYRTLDGGVTWKPVKWELPPEGDDVIYTAETAPQFFGKNGQEGVLPVTYRKKDNSVTGTVWYRSSDGGDSWRQIPSGAPVGYSEGPAITGPTLPILGDPDHLWLLDGEQGRLYRSVDGGKRWERIQDSPALQLASVIFSDARNGLLVSAGQVMQTSDGGRTWKAVAPSK